MTMLQICCVNDMVETNIASTPEAEVPPALRGKYKWLGDSYAAA